MRRIRTALRTGRVNTVKTLAGYDFSFQPSLDKSRILALASLDFIERAEVVHLLGPPGTGPASRIVTPIVLATSKIVPRVMPLRAPAPPCPPAAALPASSTA